MVIWSEIRMGQHRHDDHREHAPHFTNVPYKLKTVPKEPLPSIASYNFVTLSHASDMSRALNEEFLLEFPFYQLLTP